MATTQRAILKPTSDRLIDMRDRPTELGALEGRPALRRVGFTFCLLSVQVAGCAGGDTSGRSDTAEGADTIAGDPACEECEIVFREVAVLGALLDPVSVSEDAAVRSCVVGVLNTGEYVMSRPVGGGELVVYDGRGQFLRTIGRPGQGPGEFGRFLQVLVGPGDTLYVADASQRRLQVPTAGGALVRSFRFLTNGQDFALLDNGTVVFHVPISQRGDPTLYLVDPNGIELDRFRTGTRDRPEEESWIVSPRPGGFWMASAFTYELFRMRLDGSVEQTLRRDVRWFPLSDGRPDPGLLSLAPSVPPTPGLMHVWEDDLGRLWTYSVIPDPDGEPGIDVRLDGRLGWFCGSPLLYDVVQSAEGDTRVQVLRPELVQDGRM